MIYDEISNKIPVNTLSKYPDYTPSIAIPKKFAQIALMKREILKRDEHNYSLMKETVYYLYNQWSKDTVDFVLYMFVTAPIKGKPKLEVIG